MQYVCFELPRYSVSPLALGHLVHLRHRACIELNEPLSKHVLVLGLLHGRLSEAHLLYGLQEEDTLICVVLRLRLVPWLRNRLPIFGVVTDARHHIDLVVCVATVVADRPSVGLLSRHKQNFLDFALGQVRLVYGLDRIAFTRVTSIQVVIKAILHFVRRPVDRCPSESFPALHVAA